MQQADYTSGDFSYEAPQDAAGLPARVAVFADRSSMRGEIAQDLSAAGFRTIEGGDVSALLDGPITLLGDVVMVDCPVVDAGGMAALARLDMRVARSGSQLIVSTSLDALDDVFAALDQSDPQILVQPSRAERIVAVGRVLADVSNARVREMTEEDRMGLLRLSQQVDSIAQQLDRYSFGENNQQNVSEFKNEYRGQERSARSGFGTARFPLPEPGLVRQIISARQARARFFDAELFADPAWDMLLDLTAAHAEHSRVCVTSLCIAAGVPATTALRWIKQLVDTGVFERVADPLDRRRAFIALSEQSLEAMAQYFSQVEVPLSQAA